MFLSNTIITTPREPTALNAELVQEEEAEAKAEGERPRTGVTMFAYRSRLEDGATGCALAWRSRESWKVSSRTWNATRTLYDGECAALARAMERATKEKQTPERLTIFTDPQAAIRRMGSVEPGPGQGYALEARRHVGALRRVRSDIRIKIGWCPVHEGVPGNEKKDEWAKLAAEKPDANSVASILRPRMGTGEPLPQSLVHQQ